MRQCKRLKTTVYSQIDMIIYYVTIEVEINVVTDEVRWNVDNPDRRTRRGKKRGIWCQYVPKLASMEGMSEPRSKFRWWSGTSPKARLFTMDGLKRTLFKRHPAERWNRTECNCCRSPSIRCFRGYCGLRIHGHCIPGWIAGHRPPALVSTIIRLTTKRPEPFVL